MELAAAVIVVLIGSTIGPLLLKRADWRRQDQVAERVEAAASKAEAATESAAVKAEEAAALLVSSNADVADAVMQAARVHNVRLDQIHALVNSNLTEAKEKTLTITKAFLAHTRQTHDPKIATSVAALELLEAEVEQQEQELADRAMVTKLAQDRRAADTTKETSE